MRKDQLDMMQQAMERETVDTYVATIGTRRTGESEYEADKTVFLASDEAEAQVKLREHMIYLFGQYEDIWYISGQVESMKMQSLRRCDVDYLTRPYETMTESVYLLTLKIDELERERTYEDVAYYHERYWPIDKLLTHLEGERTYHAEDYIARHLGEFMVPK